MRFGFFVEDDNDLILDLKKESLNKLGNVKFKTNLDYFFRDVVCGEFNELNPHETRELSELLLNEDIESGYFKKTKIEGCSLFYIIDRFQSKVIEAISNNNGIIISKGYDFQEKHFKKTILCNKPRKTISNLQIYSCEITYKKEEVYAGLLKWADIEEKHGPISSKWVAYPSPFKGLIIRTKMYSENFGYDFYMYNDFNKDAFNLIKKTIEYKSISR